MLNREVASLVQEIGHKRTSHVSPFTADHSSKLSNSFYSNGTKGPSFSLPASKPMGGSKKRNELYAMAAAAKQHEDESEAPDDDDMN
jgi:hypothetical protein